MESVLRRLIDEREDLILVDAYDAVVDMSDGSKQIFQHQAYIAQVQEDGTLIPYNPTQNELVLLYLKEL